MEKKKIPLIAFAVFGIAILLAYGNVEKVYAITFQKVHSFEEDIVVSVADFNTDTLWTLVDGGVSAGDTFVYGCDLTDNNACVRYNISGNYNTNAERLPQDMWCGRSYCYVSFGDPDEADMYPNGGNLLRFATVAVPSSGIAKGDIVNPILNRTNGGLYQIDGKDSLTGGFGGVNVWVTACNVAHASNPANCRHTVILFDGITMGASQVFPEYFSGNGGFYATDLKWNNVAGANGRLAWIGTNHGDLTSKNSMVYNTATFAKICDSTSGNLLETNGGGTISFINSTHYYVTGQDSDSIHAQMLRTNSATGCDNPIAGEDITNTNSGLSTLTGIRDIVVLADQDTILMQEGGANARISVMSFDGATVGTEDNPLDTFPTTSQIVTMGEFTLRHTFNSDGTETRLTNKLWLPYSGADRTILYIDLLADEAGEDSDPEEGEGAGVSNGVCLNIDANGDGKINVLDCVGQNTAFAGITGGQNVTDITASITDGTGFTNCGTDNPDHETCGSGLFLFIFVLILAEFFSLAGYLGFARKANAEVQLMDIGLLMLIIAFAVIALGFYLNWIPDIVFYSIIVLVAGLLTFGLIKHFRGG